MGGVIIKRFIFIVLLIGLLSISSVSADNVTVGDFNEFQSLVDESPSFSIINLTKDYAYSEGDSRIVVNKNITLNGNNHVFDAKNSSGIFRASGISFNNIIFKNAYSDYGSAIRGENISINNCTFIGNQASHLGGAIFGSNIQVNNSKFYNNRAVWGAGLDIENSNVSNSYFLNNSASVGGAVFQEKSVISHSYFLNNSAESGGAVYQEYSKIFSSLFENNTADYGGAVTSFYSTIKSSKFFNNSAKYEGGALYSFYGDITSSEFINNSADHGGAIYSISNTIQNCVFKDNHQNYGHDIYPDENDVPDYPDDDGDGDVDKPSEHNNDKYEDSKDLSLIKSGNPLLILLFSLIFVPFLSLRRFK